VEIIESPVANKKRDTKLIKTPITTPEKLWEKFIAGLNSLKINEAEPRIDSSESLIRDECIAEKIDGRSLPIISSEIDREIKKEKV